MLVKLERGRRLLRYQISHSARCISDAIQSCRGYSQGYGREFWEIYNFLQKSQWWSKERLEEYQIQQMTNLLNYAYENVHYYRKMFDEMGLKPRNIQDLNDFKKLAILTKDDFKLHFGELVSRNISSEKIQLGHTSGTSGKPLQFYTSWAIAQKELAFIFHLWSRVGFKPGEPRIEIRGQVIENEKRFEFDPVYKILRLSPRLDNKEVAQYYLEKMRDFKSDFVYGYPSTIASLAHAVRKYGLSPPSKFKAVLFASETVYDWQREIVSDVFKCRVFSHYGMAEQAVLAAECEDSVYYHCVPQYGITEFGKETGEIIGTSFLNYINPFIRYRTTDIASETLSSCKHCHRAYYPVFKKVEGRKEDYLVTSHGLVGPAVITHPFKDLKTIKDTQIIQKSIDFIILKVSPWDKKEPLLYESEVEYLKRNFQIILGSDMRIEVEKVDMIEREKSGKFKWIISDISKNMLENGLQ